MAARTEIKYVCTSCGQKEVNFGYHSLGGLNLPEQGAFVQSLLLSKGWQPALIDDKAEVLCPDCLRTRLEYRRSLKPFDPRSKCPKCGCNKVGTKYCDGKTPDCHLKLPAEHLHRSCLRCGYSFAQSTKDSKPPSLKPKEHHEHPLNGEPGRSSDAAMAIRGQPEHSAASA